MVSSSIWTWSRKKKVCTVLTGSFFLLHVHIEELTILDLLGGSSVGLGILLLLGLGVGVALLIVRVLILGIRVMGLDVQVAATEVGTGLVGQAGSSNSGNKGKLGGGSTGQRRIAKTQQGVAVINNSGTSGSARVDGTARGGAIVQRDRRARLRTSAGKGDRSRVG